MGSRFKKSVISEDVRKSLSKWQRRVKDKQSSSAAFLSATSTPSSDFVLCGIDKLDCNASNSEEGSFSGTKDISLSHVENVSEIQRIEELPCDKEYHDDGVEDELSVLAAVP